MQPRKLSYQSISPEGTVNWTRRVRTWADLESMFLGIEGVAELGLFGYGYRLLKRGRVIQSARYGRNGWERMESN